MTKRRKSPHQAKRKTISSSRGPQKTTAALSSIKEKPSPGRWDGRNIVPIVIALGIAAIPFGFGKYFEFNSPGPFDSGAYAYSASHYIDGAQIGVEEIPSAKIGTFLVNVLGVRIGGFSDTGPKIVQMVLQAGALLLMFFTMRRVFGTLAGAISVTLAAFYLSAPVIAKFGNVKEQYMIAFMVSGVCCLIWRYVQGRWYWAVLSGALIAWAPLFKETGISAQLAMGAFILLLPILKHRTVKHTAQDVGLLLAGAAISIAPIFIWMEADNNPMPRPYAFAWKILFTPQRPTPIQNATEQTDPTSSPDPNHPEAQTVSTNATAQTPPSKSKGYVSKSRELFGFSQQYPIVLRYYRILILPIALALGAILLRIVTFIHTRWLAPKARTPQAKEEPTKPSPSIKPDHLVLLLALWWLLDMIFVWISTRSYEQYYLPLNASAAMLAGYLFYRYASQFRSGRYTTLWWVAGMGGLSLMVALAWPIYAGIETSPFSGKPYGRKNRGYVQKWQEVQSLKQYENNMNLRMDIPEWQKAPSSWQRAGDYIRFHSDPDDKIYIWGWIPGIYVRAQRYAPTRYAFTSEMHVWNPSKLHHRVQGLLWRFETNPPRFIVDTRKDHFPWNRPILELWPSRRDKERPESKKDFWPADPQIVAFYNQQFQKQLAEHISAEEARRFEAMEPLRKYIRDNYEIVEPVTIFWPQVLFQRK